MYTLETEGLRIPWKFKSLPKEKALAMTRALGANAGRYGSDVRSKYLDVRRDLRARHERHLFRNSYRNGKFIFFILEKIWLSMVIPEYHSTTLRFKCKLKPGIRGSLGFVHFLGYPKIPGCVLILSSKLSSLLLKKRSEEIIETSPMLSDDFHDYMFSRMMF